MIDGEVYCTVIIRPEHDPNCQGNCAEHGCPIPVQDYGDTKDLARAILASDWLAAHVARASTADRERVVRVEALADELDDEIKERRDETHRIGAQDRGPFVHYTAGLSEARDRLRDALTAPHVEQAP